VRSGDERVSRVGPEPGRTAAAGTDAENAGGTRERVRGGAAGSVVAVPVTDAPP